MDISISYLLLILNIGLISSALGDNLDKWKAHFFVDPLDNMSKMRLNISVPYIDDERSETALFLLTIEERNHSKLNEDISESAEVKVYLLSHEIKEAQGNSSMEYSILAAAPIGSLQKLKNNAQATLKLCDGAGTCITIGGDLSIRKKYYIIWKDVCYIIIALAFMCVLWKFRN
ncbi:uncharacterized protein LOC131934863 isoform X2 [Physella acuta]|uniref:uncharacterized protein LOC131934863 isoform X2 n=1 Tax=Physella acuta TaxID=109671 RepID=UPI0027DBDD65|nr:uncharacterized protein LOC131934863 isoform X2 [Physella acuta]